MTYEPPYPELNEPYMPLCCDECDVEDCDSLCQKALEELQQRIEEDDAMAEEMYQDFKRFEQEGKP